MASIQWNRGTGKVRLEAQHCKPIQELSCPKNKRTIQRAGGGWSSFKRGNKMKNRTHRHMLDSYIAKYTCRRKNENRVNVSLIQDDPPP